MRSANPALKESIFLNAPRVGSGDNAMTVNGTVNCTAILLGLLVLSAAWTWNLSMTGQNPMLYVIAGGIGALITVIVASFKKEWSPVLAPIYALLEGLVLGSISAVFEVKYPGIAIQAIGLTFGTLGGLLLAYKSGLIRATENFKLGVFAATAGLGLFYLATMVLSFFNIQVPFVFENGLIGIGFSLFVVTIAALNLVMDFDFIENGASQGVPKYMEWFAALGLMVTLVWLYVEFLRLLAKLRSRD